MIQSMTGYGKAEALLEGGKVTVEIRTLNGKNADIGIKTSLLPKERELAVRALLASRLVRGTIDFFMTWEPNAAEAAKPINGDAFLGYLSQVHDLYLRGARQGLLSGNGVIDDGLLLGAVLRLPDVVDARKADVITDANWPLVEGAILRAIEGVEDFRRREGAALVRDVTGRIRLILELEDEVERHESERIDAVRERIRSHLAGLGQQYDPLRFEQELVYYLEKMDINEEKVRLRQHCRHFLDTVEEEPYPGKKLGFIIQEIGREINTTGSKANHALIQKSVVQMKDEIEKVREQTLNIL